jgi:hypothetical protein
MGEHTEASSCYVVMATATTSVVVVVVVEVVSGDCTDEGFWGKSCEKIHPVV